MSCIIGIIQADHIVMDTLISLIELFKKNLFIDWHEAWLDNTAEFNVKLVDWLIWYNTKRPYWSLRL